MTDVHSREVRSKNMAAIKSRNTGLERKVFRELRRKRIYFKTHYSRLVGSPDIVLVRKKKVIFIDGDFWHGYKFSELKRRLSNKFWREKITRNIKRDSIQMRSLKKDGWHVFRIWEHEINKNFDDAINRIVLFLKS